MFYLKCLNTCKKGVNVLWCSTCLIHIWSWVTWEKSSGYFFLSTVQLKKILPDSSQFTGHPPPLLPSLLPHLSASLFLDNYPDVSGMFLLLIFPVYLKELGTDVTWRYTCQRLVLITPLAIFLLGFIFDRWVHHVTVLIFLRTKKKIYRKL